MAIITGTAGNDNGIDNAALNGTNDPDQIDGLAGNDSISGMGGDDELTGGLGDDLIFGSSGSDTAYFNVSTDGADTTDLGADSDVVLVSAAGAGQVRLRFTSAEVGNGNANDSNTMMNQDGGLAVRMQAEDGMDMLTGPVSRYDDEGIVFVANTPGLTFDVRDLVTGVQRGDLFEVVVLGTNGDDTLTAVQNMRPYYFNAGQGNDTITDGIANDFLVGGAGNDTLTATMGDDAFIGGGGVDTITGGAGTDRIAAFNILTDGADSVNLGLEANEVFNVGTNTGATTNVRLTFTSAEVGNGNANDSNTMANQDGGLAIRMQAEDGMGTLPMGGSVTRVDDEGVVFVAGTGVTFDVRDLVSGAARGELFEVVALGTNGNDTMAAVQNSRPYYFNGGQGNDTITDGTANDFLVGGAGNDTLTASAGDDSFIGGGGNDTIAGGEGTDRVAAFNILTDGADSVNLGLEASDIFNVGTNTGATTNVRLTFTSAEVGNGNANDSNSMANQDGGLAIRMQAEDGTGTLPGGGNVTRADDEGVIFVAGAGVTFDVRDLVSGAARGELFEVVVLGTQAADALTAVQSTRPYYINAGAGDDMVIGGNAADFLVGGAGNDNVRGGLGTDSILGGGGNDSINGEAGIDTMTGGLGNDVYHFDTVGDTAVEAAGEGSDIVRSTVSVNGLAANIESIQLNGAAGLLGKGNELANAIAGNSGNNNLQGLAGNDSLVAGDGNDVLVGGLGRDYLTGGNGGDDFHFDAAAESVVGAARDIVVDFAVGLDDLDFNTMDANSAVAGNQNFTWQGTGAFTGAGQLRYIQSGGNTIVQGNLDNNLATVEFEVQLNGLKALTVGDIVL